MSVRLRAWAERDLPVLAAIRSNEALQAQLMGRPKPGDAREWLERRSSDPNGAFFVIDDAGACAGFVQLTRIQRGASAFAGICVAPGLQGMGLGTEALELIDAHAREVYGVRTVRLEVLESNTRAIALYERLGWRRVGATLLEK